MGETTTGRAKRSQSWTMTKDGGKATLLRGGGAGIEPGPENNLQRIYVRVKPTFFFNRSWSRLPAGAPRSYHCYFGPPVTRGSAYPAWLRHRERRGGPRLRTGVQ